MAQSLQFPSLCAACLVLPPIIVLTKTRVAAGLASLAVHFLRNHLSISYFHTPAHPLFPMRLGSCSLKILQELLIPVASNVH